MHTRLPIGDGWLLPVDQSTVKCLLPLNCMVAARGVSLIEPVAARGMSRKGESGSACNSMSSCSSPQCTRNRARALVHLHVKLSASGVDGYCVSGVAFLSIVACLRERPVISRVRHRARDCRSRGCMPRWATCNLDAASKDLRRKER